MKKSAGTADKLAAALYDFAIIQATELSAGRETPRGYSSYRWLE
jgi:hypothetical protein